MFSLYIFFLELNLKIVILFMWVFCYYLFEIRVEDREFKCDIYILNCIFFDVDLNIVNFFNVVFNNV